MLADPCRNDTVTFINNLYHHKLPNTRRQKPHDGDGDGGVAIAMGWWSCGVDVNFFVGTSRICLIRIDLHWCSSLSS